MGFTTQNVSLSTPSLGITLTQLFGNGAFGCLSSLSTPSLGITSDAIELELFCRAEHFQLPLSGSRSARFAFSSRRRGPPFNSLSRDHQLFSREERFIRTEKRFQLPLSGSRSPVSINAHAIIVAFTFNSLSRDHLPIRLVLRSSTGSRLSTPSLGITGRKTTGAPRLIVIQSFNSLSRDHFRRHR